MTSRLQAIFVTILSRQICLHFKQVLEVTLTDMVSQNVEKQLLVVSAVCNLLDKINTTVFNQISQQKVQIQQQNLHVVTGRVFSIMHIDIHIIKYVLNNRWLSKLILTVLVLESTDASRSRNLFQTVLSLFLEMI